MSDAVLIAVIGVSGTVIGSIATIVVAMLHRKAGHAPPIPGQQQAPTLVLGQLVDIRELRILRALYGESKGRLLEAYKDKYYRPALDATVKKGWVQLVKGRYHMTAQGATVSHAYLAQLHSNWKP